MDLALTQVERRNLKAAYKIIKKWRDILHIDPIWTVRIEVYNTEEIEEEGMDLALFNLSNAEYFVAVLSLSNDLMIMEEGFENMMDDIACHELVHLSSGDFYRTAQLAAGGNEQMQKELKYKYEQFTSRMQKAFMTVNNKLDKMEEMLKEAKEKIKTLEEPTEPREAE